MVIGWIPKSALDFITSYDRSTWVVNGLKRKLWESLNRPMEFRCLDKAKQSVTWFQQYIPPNYVVLWRVWINESSYNDDYSKSQQYDKL